MKAQEIKIGVYAVNLVVDDDGHLSVYVSSTDGTSAINVTDEMGGRDEVSMRVSTGLIEAAAEDAENALTSDQKLALLEEEGYEIEESDLKGFFYTVNDDASEDYVTREEAIEAAYENFKANGG